jgi:hypothetical protein
MGIVVALERAVFLDQITATSAADSNVASGVPVGDHRIHRESRCRRRR